MDGVIIQDDVDRQVLSVIGIQQLKKFDELLAFMLFTNKTVHPAVQKVNAGKQGDSAEAAVLIGAVLLRWRQVRCNVRDGLDAWLLVI